jgi:hypothetical protein
LGIAVPRTTLLFIFLVDIDARSCYKEYIARRYGMFKKFIIAASLLGIATSGHAMGYDVSADNRRISQTSNVVVIDDFGTCIAASMELERTINRNNRYPYLSMPKGADGSAWANRLWADTKYGQLGSGSKLVFNPRNNKYYKFHCDWWNSPASLHQAPIFVEVLTIEQVQSEIDKDYAIYIDSKNQKSAAVDSILGM